jgi:tetratricopeptide (TPR) repeat protein
VITSVLLITAAIGGGQTDPGSARAAQLERELLVRNDARLYVELAREYERLGRRERAEATLRNGVAAASDTRLARAALVDFLARAERWNDALAAAGPFASDSSGRSLVARLRVNAGIAAFRAGDRQRARAEWEAALAADPSLVEAAVDLAVLLLELGQRDSARAVVANALTRHKSDARLLALHARTLEGPEALAAALKALRQRRADRPQDEAAGLELAGLLAVSGKRLEAMMLYDTLVNVPGATEAAFTGAVEFWMDRGESKTAVNVAERGLERFPQSGRLYALLGEAEAQRSEWRRAANAYRRAIRLEHQSEPLELSLLDVYVAGGDTGSALALAQDLTARPASRATLVGTAQRAAALNAPALADTIYQLLLERDSLDTEALEAGAALVESAGDTARAVSLYARAVAQDSSGPAPPLALLRLTRPPPDSARLLLRRGVWRGVAALQALELSGAAAAISSQGRPRALARVRPDIARQQQVRDLLRAALDTMVFHTPWGRAELAELRLAYPYSALLQRYAADVAAGEGSDSTALATYEQLLRRDARNPEVQRKRAAVLERQGRLGEAIDGFSRALDLEPESEPTFRTLLRLQQSDGTLEALLGQVRRLRARLPDSRLLAEHEIELLQRLGRLAEAQEAAAKLKEKKP